MTNYKKKGNAGENRFANWLQKNGITAYRNSSSGANERKSDVHNGLSANFEMKTVKKLNLLKAWRQSERDAGMSHTIPYVVIHFDGMPEDSWLMVMDNDTWLGMVKQTLKEEISKNVEEDPPVFHKDNLREMLWAVRDLKKSCTRVEKILGDISV